MVSIQSLSFFNHTKISVVMYNVHTHIKPLQHTDLKEFNKLWKLLMQWLYQAKWKPRKMVDEITLGVRMGKAVFCTA